MTKGKDAALSGMTGFGRADGALDGWNWSVEARSVNGRSLEMRFRGPPGFEGLDRAARAAAQARMTRGQINVGLQLKRPELASQSLTIDETLLARFSDLARTLVDKGAAPPRADGLLALKGVITAPEEEADTEFLARLETALTASVETALDQLLLARRHEGAQLRPVIGGFVASIEALIQRAEAEAASQVQAIRDRFTRRMAELAPDTPGLEDRIVLEAAALATRADVREELDRLVAHVASARALLDQPPAGRKLDFLMQEFMREANTLCSKSATTVLTGIGLELKAVIEQLREQVQNVE